MLNSERSARFDDEWARLVSDQQKEIDASRAERHFGRLQDWRGYELLKARTKILIEKLAVRGEAEALFVEEELDAVGGKLKGRPDRVSMSEGILEVEDFKTGSIYEAGADDSAPSLREGYRRQVLLYAAMVFERLGLWPVRGRVLGVGGDEEIVAVDPRAASQCVNAAIELLEKYNHRLSHTTDPIELATPSEEACGFCRHQVRCPAYWQAVSSDWVGHLSLRGTVLRRQRTQTGLFAFEVQVEGGTIRPGRSVLNFIDSERFVGIDSLGAGGPIRATRLVEARGAFRPGWFTDIEWGVC
jgi:hypothetical protein